MALSCGGKTLKYTLFTFNFIFWLTGVSLIGIGLFILLNSSASTYLHVGSIDHDLIKAAAITVTVVGVLIFFVSALGCCGACNESKACLNGFAVFLAFIILLQVIAIILAGALHSTIEKELRDEMLKTMHKFDNDSLITDEWNFMQMKMKCCGVDNRTDWEKWYHNPDYSNATIPASCCVHFASNSTYSHPIPEDPEMCYTNGTYAYEAGCYQGLKDWFISKVGIFIAVVSVIIFIQLFVVILSCVLKKKITAYEYV